MTDSKYNSPSTTGPVQWVCNFSDNYYGDQVCRPLREEECRTGRK
ncbi:hypothetical protein [Parahaliea mediterranea]|nr:hypothetical protein [Parahaliea mediterranea]